MGGRRFPLLAAAIVLASGSVHGPAWGQRACVFTENDCPDQDLTTRTVQLGGAGSLSSNGSAFGNPGRLDDGTIAEADLEFSFDRSTGRLTLVARNQTASTASLTGVGLNTAPGVTGMTLLSHDGNLPWELAFDADRLDGVVDTHPSLPELKMDGFGRLNAFLGNSGIDTGETGGGEAEIPAGGALTFLIQISGDPAAITACSFAGTGTWILPGEKIVTSVGRFQAGAQGGTGFITPCGPGGLLVELADFEVEPGDRSVRIRWETASETDSAGFAVLRRELRTGRVARLNQEPIPAEGAPLRGASYSYLDTTAQNGVKYQYRLEDFDTRGFNTIHPPAVTVSNPQDPPIRLVSPEYEESAGASVVMRWRSDSRVAGRLEISSGPGFRRGETTSIHVGAADRKRLPPPVLGEMRRMSQEGEGGVYWRVIAVTPEGISLGSETFFLVMER